jgi:hypothetical protein
MRVFCLQSNATPTLIADRIFFDKFETGDLQGGDQLGQGIDIAAYHPAACFHALDGWKRESRPFGKASLIEAEKGTGGAQLRSSNHVSYINYTIYVTIYSVYTSLINGSISILASNGGCGIRRTPGLSKITVPAGDGHMRAQEIYGRYRVLIAAIAAQAEWTADWIGDLRHTVRLFESEMGHLEQVNAQQLRNKLCVQLEQEASLLGGGRRRQAFLAAAKLLKVDA